jgi:DICT domain-containing protein
MSRFTLSIGELVARTGVSEPTLRMWERRHGFPMPERTARGHRRYSAEQAQLVERVVAARNQGLPLGLAIERATSQERSTGVSLFSALHRLRPELALRQAGKRELIALSHAIEDEVLARAEAQIFVATFQRESFYRRSERRWLELSHCIPVSAVFADFERPASPYDRPVEVPIGANRQLAREWSLICFGGASSVAMVARESASSNINDPADLRHFELLWTVDEESVRAIAQLSGQLASAFVPELAGRLERALAAGAAATPSEQARFTASVLGRTLSLVSLIS